MPLYTQILVAMILGLVTGLIFGKQVSFLGEFGKIIIQLIKVMAAPLLFFAIVDAFMRTQMERKRGLWLAFICTINTTLAVVIGLGLSNWLEPGKHMVRPETAVTGGTELLKAEKIDFVKAITGYIPQNIVQPFQENSVLTIVLLALLAGLALRKIKDDRDWQPQAETMDRFVQGAFRATEIILAWIIMFIPLAVFGVIAKTVGEQGLAPLKGLAVYVGVALLGLAIQVFVVYQFWIFAVARESLRRFWSAARDAIVYALGASSSLATLPVTLKSIDKLGVSHASARMAACVGTNFNNDGILLYEAMAVLFVAQVHGIEMSYSQQLVAALSCVIAGIGIAGVPDAGLISLALVLATVGLPLEILPLLLTVDWILSRARATTNVISDIAVARLLDHFTGHAPTRRR
ncbi:MAG TPA: dicarboxylate/amino acid:cation symporter [Bdellovibrionales bacterium]|nr:dicarboxylate/amino acid:cation symporter [Bdellovibrionales bacterium]